MRALYFVYLKFLASFSVLSFLDRPQKKGPLFIVPSVIERELEEFEEQQKRIQIKRNRGIPIHLPRIRKKYFKNVHYVSTKSRNVRDLDQRKIRRKNINY